MMKLVKSRLEWGVALFTIKGLIRAGVSGVQWILVNSAGLSGFTKVPAVRQRCSHLVAHLDLAHLHLIDVGEKYIND